MPHWTAVGYILGSSGNDLVATVPESYARRCAEPFDLAYVPLPIRLPQVAISLFWHARLGLQVVVEDYFHHRTTEIFLQLLITFACALGALASLYAIGRIALLA